MIGELEIDRVSIRSASIVDRLRPHWPLLTAAALSLIWVPALGRGFSSDDFFVVPVTWAQFLENPFSAVMDGRPVDMLTFALLPAHAFVQHAASLLVYLGCIALMWHVCRALRLERWPTFFALSAFFHPAFLWSVTWIAQRNSVLAILFLLAAVAVPRTPARLALIVLGSATKAPYFFQNLVFSYQFARRRQWVAGAIPVLCMLVFGLAGYLTYYDRAAAEATLASAAVPGTVEAALRVGKLVEGMVYVFAPVPMFAGVSWGPALALLGYAALWFVVARSCRPVRSRLAAHGWIAAMALSMCVPFFFASEVRVTGEAAVLAFLAVAAAARWRPAGIAAGVGILVLNLTGIALNYGAFRSEVYDIHATPVSADGSQPAYVYQSEREKLRQRVMTLLGISAPVRTFE
jgi:hypothetical protein